MEVEVPHTILSLVREWLLPAAVLFIIEVLLYTVYRRLHPAAPPAPVQARPASPPKHNPSPLVECWGRSGSGGLRSDCSTAELPSEADLGVPLRDVSGGRPSDGNCTAPSCSMRFEDFGEGARRRRQLQHEEGTQSLHASFAHLSIPKEITAPAEMLPEPLPSTGVNPEDVAQRLYAEAAAEDQATTPLTPSRNDLGVYSKRDLLRTLCFLKQQGLLLRPESFVCFRSGHARRRLSDKAAPTASQQQQQQGESGRSELSSVEDLLQQLSNGEEQQQQQEQQQHWGQPAASSEGSSSRSGVSEEEECVLSESEQQQQQQQQQTLNEQQQLRQNRLRLLQESQQLLELSNTEQIHYLANIEAVPVLQRAQKLRQVDIAVTIYTTFKLKRVPLRPETFTLLVHCALASQRFELAIEWLVEFLSTSRRIEARWLDRVIAATAVGAPHLLQLLLQQLQQLQHSDKLTEDCCYVVRNAEGYIALTAAAVAAGMPLTGAPTFSKSPPQHEELQQQQEQQQEDLQQQQSRGWRSSLYPAASECDAEAEEAAAAAAAAAAERANKRAAAAATAAASQAIKQAAIAAADVWKAAAEVKERGRIAALTAEEAAADSPPSDPLKAAAAAQAAAEAAAAAKQVATDVAAAEAAAKAAKAAAKAAAAAPLPAAETPGKKLNPNAPEFVPVLSLALQQQRALQQQEQQQQQQQQQQQFDHEPSVGPPRTAAAAATAGEPVHMLSPDAAAERLQREIEDLQSSSEQHPHEQQVLQQLQQQLLLLVEQHHRKRNTRSPASSAARTPQLQQLHRPQQQQQQQQLLAQQQQQQLLAQQQQERQQQHLQQRYHQQQQQRYLQQQQRLYEWRVKRSEGESPQRQRHQQQHDAAAASRMKIAQALITNLASSSNNSSCASSPANPAAAAGAAARHQQQQQQDA